MTKCPYLWMGETSCPRYPGPATGPHECRREREHDLGHPYQEHLCRCGAVRLEVLR